MELRQKTELRGLLIPELNQSLKILALPLLDLKAVIDEELLNNPLLEEIQPKASSLPKAKNGASESQRNSITGADQDFRMSLITKKVTLQEVLMRQLGMFADTNDDFRIGQEIIGNLDENGYLKVTLDEIAAGLQTDKTKVEKTLKLIQQFEPAGVAARSIPECLLIQLDLANEKDPLLLKIIEDHLQDVAKKNYSHIAKALNEPLEKIEPLIKMLLRLDPKPGRNFSAEETQHVIPDIMIYDKDDEIQITINDEDIPTFNINKDYKTMLKNNNLDQKTKEFLTGKFKDALLLLRAVYRRKATLRKIMETIVEIQQEAIQIDLSHLKPLTFQEVAQKIEMHESTVCRAIMNKYVRLPFGVIALKEFFPSHIHDNNGNSQSSAFIKRIIKELLEQEDKKKPLSDADIVKLIAQKNDLKIARRTVTKYREELKLPSSTYRRIR